VISDTTSAEMREMLRGVLADGGTASGADIPGYDLAGKTGTANVVVDGKYSSSDYIASFIGMVPASAPKLVVAVMVDEPHGSIYGGSVAAPAFQKIVGWAVPYLGINPDPAGVRPNP
jgi:cell division protein FtsI/penicillin-binding protein 2